MKRVIKVLAVFTMLCISLQTKAQTVEEMKKWTDFMTPSIMHKIMASMDGEWTESIIMYMAPDAPPMTMESTCKNEMILGGRYQLSKHTGNFSGMPFEGISTLAWDNLTNKFYSTWIDNMGTGLTYLEGKWDEGTKTIYLSGLMTDPMQGKQVKMREELIMVDEDSQIMTQFSEKDGKEFKTMQITLKRKK